MEAFNTALAEYRKFTNRDRDNTYIQALAFYQETIRDAFGITYEGSDWTLVNTHFVRQGAEKVADALANWAAEQGIMVNPSQFYQQVFGPMKFVNSKAPVEGYYAKSNGATITVYSRQGGGQRVMTPNNVIHELGHSFDRFSGTVGLSVTATHGPATRDGMGYPNPRYFLNPSLFMAAGRWVYENETFEFKRDSGMISETDAEALGLPDICVGREFWGIKGWATGLYRNDYSHLALLDQLRQSFDMVASEVIADAFLNWVVMHEARANGKPAQGFDPTSRAGQQWIEFMDGYMATFCGNAILSHNADLRAMFYQRQEVLPTGGIKATVVNDAKNLRRTPGERQSRQNIINTLRELGRRVGQTVHIYGKISDGRISDLSRAWLLMGLPDGRWGWVASRAMDIDLDRIPEVDYPRFEQFCTRRMTTDDLLDIIAAVGELNEPIYLS